MLAHLTCLALCMRLCSAGIACCADHSADQHPNLSRIVNLRLGEVALSDACTVLSRQTERKIEGADAVADRMVILSIRHVSARGALNAICDINGLRWYRKDDGSYAIDRPAVRRPRNFAELGLRLQECLPPDTRRFLGFGVTPDELLLRVALIRYTFDTPVERLRYEIARKVDDVANDEG